jgi:chemotaxis protein methyltransferase CheR
MSFTAQEAADYDYVIELVYEHSRIRLNRGKHALIQARLGKRIRQHGFESLHQYCNFLRQDADSSELTAVVDALATNFTSFLREKDHFDILVQQAIARLQAARNKPFRVWSAGCATGEEPYSIAFYLAEHFPVQAGWNWRILATDISTKALDEAMQGIYPTNRMVGLPQDWVRRYFQRGNGAWEGHFRVKPWVQERIRWEQLNLHETFRLDQECDVIFCRNVLIYFDRETQMSLVRQLVRFLAPGGYLFTGHAESLSGASPGLHCLRPSVYQKV